MNCQYCGGQLAENATVCNSCGATLEQPTVNTTNTYEAPVNNYVPQGENAAYTAPVVEEKKENVFTGIIGALLGACIGAAVIIILSRLGYVASISGFVLAICTIKGYQLLGRKMSVKGLIICLLLIVATPYLADRIDWAFTIVEYYASYGYEVTLPEAFLAVPEFISEGAIELSDYLVGLGMIYFFALLGAIGTIKNAFKSR